MRTLVTLLVAVAPLIPAGPARAGTSELWGADGGEWSPDGRLPDFSHAGYACGERPIPEVPVATDVRDHGAGGDGSTDDTDAFLAAVRAVAESGRPGAVSVPPGRYLIRKPIEIRDPGIVLRGAGAGESVLVFDTPLNEIAPNWGATTGGRRTSNYSWSGGFVSIQGSDRGRLLGQVSDPARLGDRELVLDRAVSLAEGDWVQLRLCDDADRSLLGHLYSDDPGDLSEIKPGTHRVDFTSRVAAADGTKVRLERPLPFDLRPEWQPALHRFEPTVTDCGVERLGFEFPARMYQGHFTELGFNAVAFGRVAHCWARQLRIVNADSGIFASGRFCTISDIVCDLNGATPRRGEFGHHGVSLTGCDNLLTRFDLRHRFIHDLTVSKGSGNVASAGRGLDLALDHHKRAPFANLFTDLDAGAGTRLWKCGGGQALGRNCGGRGTFWNIRSDQPQEHPGGFGPASINLVGLSTAEDSVTEDDGRWFEAIAPDELRPADLHAAQLERRLDGEP